MAETKSYDVILSDARMPEMGGLDFYAILRYKLGYTWALYTCFWSLRVLVTRLISLMGLML